MKKLRRKKVFHTKEKSGMTHVWVISLWTLCLLILLVARRNLLDQNTNLTGKDSQILTLQEIENLSNTNGTDNQKHEEMKEIIPFDASGFHDIRVVIRTTDFENIYHNEVLITADSSFILQVDKKGKTQEYTCYNGECLSLDMTSEFDRITVKTEVEYGEICLPSITRNQGVPAYKGIIELLKFDQGIVVINELPVEEYLLSVVPSEMPASYPEEALKAQAICARTYAYQSIRNMGFPEWNAHVDDSTGYQVYNNIEEQKETSKAVWDTAGQVLLNKAGELLTVYYYSTSCGLGSDLEVWNHQGVENSHIRPQFISELGIQFALNNNAFIGPISVSEEDFREYITSVNYDDFEYEEPWYRWEMDVEDLDYELLYRKLRENHHSTPDFILTKTLNGDYESCEIREFTKIKDIRIHKRIAGGAIHELIIETNKDTYKIITGNAIRKVLSRSDVPVVKGDGSEVKMGSLLPSAFFVIDTVKMDGELKSYRLIGGGYGHGVGMSQNAAKNMAECGYTCEQILKFFFGNPEFA